MSDPISGTAVVQRVLAFTALGLILLSLVAFFSELIAAAAGVGAHDGFSRGLWPVVLTFPGIGLPVGFVLVIVVLVVNVVGRSRANRATVIPTAHTQDAGGSEGDRRR